MRSNNSSYYSLLVNELQCKQQLEFMNSSKENEDFQVDLNALLFWLLSIRVSLAVWIRINVCYIIFSFYYSVSVSQSTLDRLDARSVMPAGSCTVWSTVSSQMVRCPLTRPLEVVMTPSTPSSARLELANTCQEPSSLISSQLLLVST